ncbi:MAG: hypothetical protein ACRD6B_10895 [Bryobacteraceae bacterium]
MNSRSTPPILIHPVQETSVFTPEALINDVRRQRSVRDEPPPAICFLEFDGDLTDWLPFEFRRGSVLLGDFALWQPHQCPGVLQF